MRKKTFLLWKKIIRWTLVSVITFLVLYVYFGTNLFKIYNYQLIGVPDDKASEIQNKLRELSSQPVYKIIPTDKLITYRGMKIKSLIKEILPNTEEIAIRAIPLHTLRITVKPYSPVFKLDEKRAVTSDGYVYEEIKSLESYPLIFVASSTMKTEDIGGMEKDKIILENTTSTEQLFSGIVNILPKIDAVLFKVSKISVNSDGDIILSDEGDKTSVKLTSSVDMDKEWSNVISAIDTEPLKTLLDTKKDKLEYIDVRFGNKVFYKFTSGSTPAIISDTNATSTATSTPR